MSLVPGLSHCSEVTFLCRAISKFRGAKIELCVSFEVDEDAKSRLAMGKETAMAWKTPKIVEVPVGMEINMYACAARK